MMNNRIIKRFILSRRILLLLPCFLIFSFSYPLHAQDSFTDRLQKKVDGKGTVRLHHDADIEALLFGRWHPPVPNKPQALHSTAVRDTTMTLADSLLMGLGRKVRINGYRVQVYAGGNSRDAKNRAYQMESQVKTFFPDQPVYTRFVSPRWICHVGDFRTHEEALELLNDMRRMGRFPEAITVRCKINAYVYDE